jgi:hypothetical protein
MTCCGFCGFTKLHLQGAHFNAVPNTFGIVVGATPYGCSNSITSTYTTTSDGVHVYVCNACFKFYEQPQRIKYVVFQNMDYMKQIFINNSLDIQLLSLINISMKIEQRNYGFMHGQIQPSGLLDHPLLYWNSKFQPTSTSKDVNLALKDLLHQNLSSNPLVQKYISNIEKPNPIHGLCVLSSSIVEEILAKTSTSEWPFSSMDVEPFVQNLSLLFDMRLGIPHNFDDAFEIGELTMRNNVKPFKTKRLLVKEDGMCMNPTLNMSFEKALFPFLFPHGSEAYDGISGLLPYLE